MFFVTVEPRKNRCTDCRPRGKETVFFPPGVTTPGRAARSDRHPSATPTGALPRTLAGNLLSASMRGLALIQNMPTAAVALTSAGDERYPVAHADGHPGEHDNERSAA